MKLKKIALRNFAILCAIALGFVACDDDFATINSDIINDDTATNFDALSERYEVVSYTNVLDPIQTSGLGLYQLGVYDDPTYGRTVASVLTQVSNGLVDPTFGKPLGEEDNLEIESVILSIPFFSRNIGVINDNEFNYEVDSILPRITTDDDIKIYESIKLSIFENSYFLRDFDPTGDFNDTQSFFSNKSASTNELISQADLEAIPIAVIDELLISDEEIRITEGTGDDEVITERLSPRVRVVWDKDNPDDTQVLSYWKTKIFDQEGSTVLSNSNNFNDYFRGLYFKAEPNINDRGSMILFDFSSPQGEANISITYSFDSPTEEGTRDESTFTLTFGPTRINFLDNTYNPTFPLNDGDETNGDQNLFLKGGEGAIASIKLFNGETSDDDNSTDNTFEAWRKDFVNLDEDGEFVSAKRLVNEANLIFYVDQDLVQGEEPERLYLYNKTDGTFLIDYGQDLQNTSIPRISIPNHLGILQRDENTDEGIRYKMRITSHINNLLLNNSENVELGLAVSGNVNLEGSVPQYEVQNPSNEDETLPVSSVITPRGTVLFGNVASPGNEDKRLVLEIFYTEPN